MGGGLVVGQYLLAVTVGCSNQPLPEVESYPVHAVSLWRKGYLTELLTLSPRFDSGET